MVFWIGCAIGVRISPTPTPEASPWASRFDVGTQHHINGNLDAAILYYDQVERLLPDDEGLLAVRTGLYLARAEAHLFQRDTLNMALDVDRALSFLDLATE